MEFLAFYERFGGSFRTKNLTWVPERAGDPSPAFVNKRLYRMPSKSGLPPEFIRLDPWEGEYLFMMARRAKQQIVEIGRFYGGSTFLLACANEKTPIVSIDLQPQDDTQLETLLREHKLGSNLTILVGDSQRTKYPAVGPIDMLFIDGDHSYEGCTADLENWYPHVVTGGHILLHDSYCGCAVQEAIVDFTARHAVENVRSPYIIASHWHTSYGSMCHFIKREE